MMRQPSAAGTGSAASAEFITIDPRRPLEIEFGNIVQAIVERTLGWLGRWRRLSKDYEELPEVSETMVTLAMIRLMLHRLAHPNRQCLPAS
jgi:hypothetical protein